MHPRKPRGNLGELLYAAKLRSGREWPEIGAEAQVNKTTREGWVTGKTAEPGLTPILRLCRVLDIKCEELVACVLDGVLPEWATGGEESRAVGSSASEGMSAKDAGRAARRQPQPRNGHGRA